MSLNNVVTLKGWSWRKAGDGDWTRCAHDKPTTEIFTDLLDAKKIPHPFLDRNERVVQWVGLEDWEYTTEFEYKSQQGNSTQDLVFEGLDTFATVYLNDQEVLYSDNMFHIHRINVNGKLKEGKNSLRILFKSAFKHGKALEEKYGEMNAFNGDHSRVYVRKAQYHYGWDWGPVLMTCGPYKEVRLESYAKAISDVFVDPVLNDDLTKATVNVNVTALGEAAGGVSEVTIESPSGKKYSGSCSFEEGKAQIEVDNPELWYVRGHGPQNRYNVSVQLKDKSGSVLDQWNQLVGIRKVELVQEKLQDAEGTSFYFRVNNIPVYSAGSDWIPAHNFLTALTKEDYLKWIQITADSNQVMIRVWGGGIYEPDLFYEACDEYGIMVWQDFMFACGQYPYYKEFRESVIREAEDQVRRLRNFCCMAVYAGNNEDYQVAEQSGLEWNPSDTNGDYTNTNFPARTAYETDLPAAVEKLSPQVPYHPGSPWGGKDTTDPTIGDIHQWNVWHGSQEKYQFWSWLGGRFISEFGMLACPSRKTVEQFVTDPVQRYPQSQVMESHCKADGFERRLALYVMENITVRSMNLDDWIYATQLIQSECIAYAYRCWRREWRGDGKRYIGGALVWQINDCYPVSSWAIVDFYGREKLAYYALKRESAPLGLGIYRCDVEKKGQPLEGAQPGPPHDLRDKKYVFDVWGVNSSLKDVEGTLEIRLFDVESGKLIQELDRKAVTLEANKTTEYLEDLAIDENTCIQARVFDSNNNLLARASDFPQPLKHSLFLNRKVKAVAKTDSIEITANGPVKGVVVSLDNEDIKLSDNGVDVFPGDPYIIQAKGIKESDKISIRYYEQDA
jgi:beta-mannosidase